jgi:hypothetical protein
MIKAKVSHATIKYLKANALGRDCDALHCLNANAARERSKSKSFDKHWSPVPSAQ